MNSLVLIVMLIFLGNVQGEFPINATVAQDGSGNFNQISDALSGAPTNSQLRYTIKIKAGTYHEYLHIYPNQTNLAFIGDGIGATIITGNRSKSSGFDTLRSATVAVEGENFTAKYITFENSAGADSGQAVALLSSSNFSAFYSCAFLGYQDTLYMFKGIQFYRECDMYGTVDFIFGSAKAVIQKCNIYARKPPPGGGNVITAQGRSSLAENNGFSIHNCSIKAASDFNSRMGVKTYLGRPWGNYATVVVMQCTIDDLIDPEGWLSWGDEKLSTLFYREYQNWGAGAGTSRRVKWKGYNATNSANEVGGFTVRVFIGGDTWLPERGIPYDPDLL
ncbi:pectinesterase-like [Malania oleifera]|uniref:pectinesterase-like n=1 Tax=Malania oleifera TaxID=397392 RepID=UPI0025AE42DF|nr:pectinesterase-like [Malania oleifera]